MVRDTFLDPYDVSFFLVLLKIEICNHVELSKTYEYFKPFLSLDCYKKQKSIRGLGGRVTNEYSPLRVIVNREEGKEKDVDITENRRHHNKGGPRGGGARTGTEKLDGVLGKRKG